PSLASAAARALGRRWRAVGAEAVAAAALRGRVRVAHAEPAAHQVLDEVDLAALEERPAPSVDDDRDAVRLELLVALEALVVDLHPVLVAAAPARPDEDAQRRAGHAAAGEDLARAAGPGLGEGDALELDGTSLHTATYSTPQAALPVADAAAVRVTTRRGGAGIPTDAPSRPRGTRSAGRSWRGYMDSHPGPTVLETAALPTELYARTGRAAAPCGRRQCITRAPRTVWSPCMPRYACRGLRTRVPLAGQAAAEPVPDAQGGILAA